MHNTIDYSKSPAPGFDAVQDIKDWLGPERWAKVYPEFAKITNCAQFALYCSLAGIRGFPVRAWYEHYHGQGSWKQEDLDGL
jgi:hypothetical protein